MMLSDVSIKRPVFATVIGFLLVAIGIVSFTRLALREYPDIDPPVVSIRTTAESGIGEATTESTPAGRHDPSAALFCTHRE